MSKQQEFDKLDLLGVEVDALYLSEAIDYIMKLAKPGHASGYIVKPYVEFLDRAYRDAEVQDLLNGADLCIADGVALTWAATYLYAGKRSFVRFWSTLLSIVVAPGRLNWPIPERAAGVNLTWPLLEAAAANNLRVYLIGSPKNSSIQTTVRFITKAVPGLIIAGARSGTDPAATPGQITNQWLMETQNAVASAKPDLILVGMGFPVQERVCAYLAGHSDHGVFIGEGGTFDYESFGGIRSKAPAWIQRTGLEWLWRLAQEPRRLRRQFSIPRFIYRIWSNK